MTVMFRHRSLAVHIAAALLFLVVCRSDAFATPIVFDVTGLFENGGSLSGTLTVDTTTGLATDANLSVSNPSVDLTLVNQGTLFGGVALLFDGTGGTNMLLSLPVADLIGYTGGQLVAGSLLYTPTGNFALLSGSATPAPDTPAVPEPATLVLLGTGLIGAVLGRRRAAR